MASRANKKARHAPSSSPNTGPVPNLSPGVLDNNNNDEITTPVSNTVPPSSKPTRSSRRLTAGNSSNYNDAITPPSFPNSRVTRNSNTSCFTFSLDPENDEHKHVICAKCIFYWSTTLGNRLGLKDKKARPTGDRYKCERPWDVELLDHFRGSKRNHYTNFYKLFGMKAPDPDDHGGRKHSTPKSKSIEKNYDEPALRVDTILPAATVEPSGAVLPVNPVLSLSLHPSFNEEAKETFIIVNEENEITVEAVNIIGKALSNRNSELKEHELHLCGMLLQLGFKNEKSNSLISVSPRLNKWHRRRPFEVARIPEQYTYGEVVSTQVRNQYVEVVSDWMECLTGGFNDSFISLALDSKPDLVRDHVTKFCNEHHRLSAETSAVMQSYIRLSATQVERLSTFFPSG